MEANTGDKSLSRVHEIIAAHFQGKEARIYEAGGGSASYVPADILKSAHVTVVDISEEQLRNNKYAGTRVLGDIQTYEFPRESFELIVCYNVIEHLDAPDEAIKQFYRALIPGGLLFIAAPNPQSFSGWVTRMTPHWFHVQFYRRVLGYKTAGQPGTVPFPTVFHSVVTPSVLISYCRNLGLNVLYIREYRGMSYQSIQQRRPFLGKLLTLAVQMANALTLWRKDLRNGDYHIVLQKPSGIEDSGGR